MKRGLSLFLAAVMLLALVPAVTAAEVEPYAPGWISASEYVVLGESAAYTSANWEKILELRALAESGAPEDLERLQTLPQEMFPEYTGGGDDGILFELMLIYFRMFMLGDTLATYEHSRNLNSGRYSGDTRARLMQWEIRASCWEGGSGYEDCDFTEQLTELVTYPWFNREQFFSLADFGILRETPEFAVNYNMYVYIDGDMLALDTAPVIIDGFSLVPVRVIAESLGADVEWYGETQTVTLKRAATEVRLVIGDATAHINGAATALDAAPALIDGYTMIPLRFVSEAFGQKVDYDQAKHTVNITEITHRADADEMERWFLGCAAILARRNKRDPYTIGMYERNREGSAAARSVLSVSWLCDNREQVIAEINELLKGDSNTAFFSDAAIVRAVPEEYYTALKGVSFVNDAFMWQYILDLDEKWGETGIAAWDWFRAVHVAGWGYVAGYLTLDEAYTLAEPVIERLREQFNSWDEATENYLDGYAYWSRTDVTRAETEYRNRQGIYADLKSEQGINGTLFDNSLWNAPGASG